LIYNPGNDGDYDDIPDPDANREIENERESTRIPSLNKQDSNQSRHGPFASTVFFIERLFGVSA